MCMFVYVCVHVVREGGTTSACVCGEDDVVEAHATEYIEPERY